MKRELVLRDGLWPLKFLQSLNLCIWMCLCAQGYVYGWVCFANMFLDHIMNVCQPVYARAYVCVCVCAGEGVFVSRPHWLFVWAALDLWGGSFSFDVWVCSDAELVLSRQLVSCINIQVCTQTHINTQRHTYVQSILFSLQGIFPLMSHRRSPSSILHLSYCLRESPSTYSMYMCVCVCLCVSRQCAILSYLCPSMCPLAVTFPFRLFLSETLNLLKHL